MKLGRLTWEIQNRILPRPTHSHGISIHPCKTIPYANDLWYSSLRLTMPRKMKKKFHSQSIQFVCNLILTIQCVEIHVQQPDDNLTVAIHDDGNFENVVFY